jgi:hypothetical protein
MGLEISYLESNRWAFSAIAPPEVVFLFPANVQRSPPRTLQLPTIEIFEAPLGCTARTEDWLFPARMEGQTEAKISSLAAPHLISYPTNRSFNENAAVFDLPRSYHSHLKEVSELLRLQERIKVSSIINGDQIQALLKQTNLDIPGPVSSVSLQLLSTAMGFLFCCIGGSVLYTFVLAFHLQNHILSTRTFTSWRMPIAPLLPINQMVFLSCHIFHVSQSAGKWIFCLGVFRAVFSSIICIFKDHGVRTIVNKNSVSAH